ncbi:MAG TPA: DUF2232 domain-containing protein [Pseudogracilibacillus sp.]|nr:DUF2232 domain-containing protein [Pseudogracilibacillus sp.]
MQENIMWKDMLFYMMIFIVIFLMTVFVPFLILISLFLLPIPVIVFTAKYNIKNGVFIFAIANLFAFFIASYIGMFLSLFVTIGALYIGHMIHKKRSPYETLLYGAIGYVLGIVVAYVGSQVLYDINWINTFEKNMYDSLDTFTSFIGQFGASDELEKQMTLIESQIDQIILSFTAIFIIIGTLFALITQWLSYKWMNWREKSKLYFPPFHSFNFPIYLIWIHLIAIIFSYVGMEDGSFFYTMFVNLLALTTMCIIVQGYSFVFFFFHNRKVHTIIPIVISIFTLIIPIFLIFIRIIGIIDIGFRLKNRLKR